MQLEPQIMSLKNHLGLRDKSRAALLSDLLDRWLAKAGFAISVIDLENAKLTAWDGAGLPEPSAWQLPSGWSTGRDTWATADSDWAELEAQGRRWGFLVGVAAVTKDGPVVAIIEHWGFGREWSFSPDENPIDLFDIRHFDECIGSPNLEALVAAFPVPIVFVRDFELATALLGTIDAPRSWGVKAQNGWYGASSVKTMIQYFGGHTYIRVHGIRQLIRKTTKDCRSGNTLQFRSTWLFLRLYLSFKDSDWLELHIKEVDLNRQGKWLILRDAADVPKTTTRGR